MANDVAVSLPQMDLPPNSTLTVTLSDAGAKITAMNVHGWQGDTDTILTAAPTPVGGAYLSGDQVV